MEKNYVVYTKREHPEYGRTCIAVLKSLKEVVDMIIENINAGKLTYGENREPHKQINQLRKEYALLSALKDEDKAVRLINEELSDITIEPSSFWLAV